MKKLLKSPNPKFLRAYAGLMLTLLVLGFLQTSAYSYVEFGYSKQTHPSRGRLLSIGAFPIGFGVPLPWENQSINPAWLGVEFKYVGNLDDINETQYLIPLTLGAQNGVQLGVGYSMNHTEKYTSLYSQLKFITYLFNLNIYHKLNWVARGFPPPAHHNTLHAGPHRAFHSSFKQSHQ